MSEAMGSIALIFIITIGDVEMDSSKNIFLQKMGGEKKQLLWDYNIQFFSWFNGIWTLDGLFKVKVMLWFQESLSCYDFKNHCH